MKKCTILLLTTFLTLFVACKKDRKVAQKNKELVPFKFKPVKPKNGVLRGVVELGASGFNAFVVNVDKNNNYEVIYKDFGASLFIEGMTNAKEVGDKFKEFTKRMVTFNVAPKNIHFLVSSGAKRAEIANVVISKLKKSGYKIEEITAQKEGEYALKATMPKKFKDSAFVVDIGSRNTKISYFQGDSIVVKETHGSKYFQQNNTDDKVYEDVKLVTQSVPLEKRGLCFIIGGAPYSMAEATRTDEKSRFTMLSSNIKIYDELAKKKGKKVKSGLTIFKAIAEVTNCKRFVFDWDANFSIGFLLDVNDKK